MQVSDDGREFRDLRDFINAGSTLSLAFEQTSARVYRILITRADAGLKRLEFSEVDLAPAYRIKWYQSKTGAGPMPPGIKAQQMDVPAFAAIAPNTVVNLTDETDAAGVLTWEVPSGHWTILRFAGASTGTENHTSSTGGMGLECDKLSGEAVERHFASFVGRLIAETGKGSALTGTHVDSWEIGFQNWTPLFCAEFQARRGYDPIPYLPTFTGRFVAGPDESERFLWDVRRTIADLLADNYAGELSELAHQHGLKLSIEGYASLGKGPFDDLLYAGRADMAMTEFWFGTNNLAKLDLHAMPSAAHTSGKPISPAEAFTSEPAFSKWQEHPFALKPLADAAFCEGVNRLVFHRFAHQPWTNRAPGMTMGPFGIHYERTQTWWELSRPWHEYLARCQYLLQQGLFVADVCYLTSEGAFTQPPSRQQLTPRLPPGYNYDLAAPEVLNRMSVANGLLVLPNGMTYRALVLPGEESMTPKMLRKIKELVEAGAVVVGPKPKRSPSLADYPQCDVEVAQLASLLWGACDGKSIRNNRVGKGMVIWGEPLAEILKARDVAPDFVSQTRASELALHSIHRQIGDVEVYFVANPNLGAITADCRFRVSGKRPEFWHPETGDRDLALAWRSEEGGTQVHLRLEAGGSVFVVFRQSSVGSDPVVSFLRNGQLDNSEQWFADEQGAVRLVTRHSGKYSVRLASGKRLETEVRDTPEEVALDGKWELHFPPRSGAPEQIELDRLISWTACTNEGIRYFSGTATYQQSFTLASDLIRQNREFFLHLGKVQVIADVKVNGVDCGILWKPPFEADVTRAIKAGDNALEINVVNLWPNRLIGDEQLPEDCKWQVPTQIEYGAGLAEWPSWIQENRPSPTGRLCFTTWKHWHKDSSLLESGLLGPVILKIAEQRTLQ